MIEANVIHQAFRAGVQRLLFLGSSCIYPRDAAQPMREDALLTGPSEPTNEPYAIAKIAGIKLCESYNRQYGVDYRSVMPTNLYGPGDNFHPENSPCASGPDAPLPRGRDSPAPKRSSSGARARRGASSCTSTTWRRPASSSSTSTAPPTRPQTQPMLSHINVGTGTDVTIAELAEMIAAVTGYTGRIHFDTSKPDGTPRKLLDVTRLTRLGWTASRDLRSGLAETYRLVPRPWRGPSPGLNSVH